MNLAQKREIGVWKASPTKTIIKRIVSDKFKDMRSLVKLMNKKQRQTKSLSAVYIHKFYFHTSRCITNKLVNDNLRKSYLSTHTKVIKTIKRVDLD